MRRRMASLAVNPVQNYGQVKIDGVLQGDFDFVQIGTLKYGAGIKASGMGIISKDNYVLIRKPAQENVTLSTRQYLILENQVVCGFAASGVSQITHCVRHSTNGECTMNRGEFRTALCGPKCPLYRKQYFLAEGATVDLLHDPYNSPFFSIVVKGVAK